MYDSNHTYREKALPFTLPLDSMQLLKAVNDLYKRTSCVCVCVCVCDIIVASIDGDVGVYFSLSGMRVRVDYFSMSFITCGLAVASFNFKRWFSDFNFVIYIQVKQNG